MLIKSSKDKNKGFTLIELLIVVAIIGMITLIMVPAMIRALQTSRQKRTLADMKGLASCLEMYNIDYEKYPQSGINNLLVFKFIYYYEVPVDDGWLNSYRYETTNEQTSYSLGSGGSDRSIPDWSTTPGTTTNFEDDLILFNGSFTVYPDGVQT